MMTDDPVLVVSDAPGDARLVKQLLDDDFSNVAVSIDAAESIADFIAHQPSILILCFHDLQKSEDFYLGLHRQISHAKLCPHRTIVLCDKSRTNRAYELCKQRQFDDYVIFWPLSFDAPRLHMAVYGGLRQLHHATVEAGRPDETQIRVRRPNLLQTRLNDPAPRGRVSVGTIDNAWEEARLQVAAALDSISRAIAAQNPDAAVGSGAQLRELESRFSTVASAMQSLRHWSETPEEALAPQLSAPEALQTITDSSPLQILVVDDDAFQHRIIEVVLAEIGATLAFAASGAEAFSLLQEFTPDLILMDFRLPDMDGALIIRNIRSIDRYSAIPIIMITGQLDKNTILQCKAAGAIDFVVKPFEPDAILAKVRHWLSVAAPDPRNSQEQRCQ